MKKTVSILLAFIGVSVFGQKKAINQKDFCSALQKIMEYSVNKFDSLKGPGKVLWRGYYTDLFWQATDSIPGFTSNTIHKTITGLPFYHATFASGADTSSCIKKYYELVEMVKKCNGTTCCTYAITEGMKTPEIKRFEFWVKTIKPGTPKAVETLNISVNYQLNLGNNLGETFIIVGYKE